jgi:hypothetical protein
MLVASAGSLRAIQVESVATGGVVIDKQNLMRNGWLGRSDREQHLAAQHDRESSQCYTAIFFIKRAKLNSYCNRQQVSYRNVSKRGPGLVAAQRRPFATLATAQYQCATGSRGRDPAHLFSRPLMRGTLPERSFFPNCSTFIQAFLLFRAGTVRNRPR